MGSLYQWFAWLLQRLLMMMSCPPMGAGSDGRALVMGAWSTRVPGGRSSRMVAAMDWPSRLVCRVSWRPR